MSPPPARTRRERLREQTLAEIKQHALDQIQTDGPDALALTQIAKSMGMSGPALYRYFASRDELLATLVGEAWTALAEALEQAADESRRRTPAARLTAICGAYRDWALEQPHRYRLALETSYGSGRFAPEATLPAAGRAMHVLLRAVAGLGAPASVRSASRTLDQQLMRWLRERSGRTDVAPATAELAVLVWTRLHGMVSLELAGVFDSMALDAALLHRAEVEHILAAAGAAS